jgi:NADPH:quinone reductase-like Zn-dependent oxidoreductase
MRVVFGRYGTVDVLEVEEHLPPPPGPGELAVDVAFAGVNYADVIARRGFYKWAPPPPTCVGFEVSGTVRELGPEVTGFAVGDRVMSVMRFGGYADRVVVEAARAMVVPAAMSLEEAAAIPAVYLTAWHALHEAARVRRGESILIQAVAGGVGIAALQLAAHAGLVTYGTASTAAKLEVARGMGLDHGIDYARLDFEAEIGRLTGGRGVDVVLDSLGGEGLRKGYRCLARGGRVVAIGAAQVAPTARRPGALLKAGVELARGGIYHPFGLIEDNRGILGVQILLYWDDVDHLRMGLREIQRLHEEGVVRPVIDSIVPLAEARRAHERLENRQSTGKILLRCQA